MKPPIPDAEVARLAALERYRILDTAPEQAFDDITRLASFICGTPIAFMSLVDRERQWFKSKLGVAIQQTSRDTAFCAYTILEPKLFVVDDALADERFADNPLVTADPHIRFYAGAPLLTAEGHALGSLCVLDRQPRQLSGQQGEALKSLARTVVTTLELRRVSKDLAEAASNLKTLGKLLPICSYCKGIRNDQGYWQQLEAYIETKTGTEFSHGICPECAAKHFPHLDLERESI